ncbi:YbhB/YbcL family Raf kinase inhibitor-like protein [Bradyrhizobium sp.]|jgi:Raf kinase inhibitor-like YbhB/YbcL family protein|uniref:YbhB/YbcL family Raf kinase inhibitor-like protein n=1 Tax=Bradyrhizobium sp. TaxID=376 RepID=UPI003D108D83
MTRLATTRLATTTLAFWIAALGVSLLGASAANAQSMSLTSPDISEGAMIANEQVLAGFGCAGGNISPALSWSGAPAGTKSFAVSMFDPDAPTGSGFWHWVVFNIPPATTSFPKGAGDLKKKLMPKGAVQSRTDLSTDGYGGPCPPAGDKPHRYQITVFAVDVDKLPFAKNHDASAALVGFDLHFHTLAKATLTGLYGR